MKDSVLKQLSDSIKVKQDIINNKKLIQLIMEVSNVVVKAYQNNNKLLIAGNGGSAADAQHIAGEIVSKFYFDRPGLPALALTTDTSIMTSIGNDYGYEQVFSRQIQANGNEGDVFLAISTSGNSVNIINAIKECKNKNIVTVCLTGQKGGKLSGICDYSIQIPSEETPRIQESHILVGHIICSILEEEMFGNNKKTSGE